MRADRYRIVSYRIGLTLVVVQCATVMQSYDDNVTNVPTSDFVPVLIVFKSKLILETGLTIYFQLLLSVSIDAKTTTEVMDLSTYSARECRLINRCKGHTSVFICVITDQVVSCSTMTAGVISDLVLMDMTTNIHV